MPWPYHKLYLCIAIAVVGIISPVFAHEYWIEPRKFQVEAGEVIEADLRNGQNFKGNMLYYLTHRFKKFEVHDDDGIHNVTGSNGDQPALKFRPRKQGLHILAYHSIFDSITFEKWDKFVTYAQNQDLTGIVERHLARKLPQTMFKEDYARTIKALVGVGNGEGSDRLTGLPFEFVAQDNPYVMDFDGKQEQYVRVRLFLDQKPVSGKQVLIFRDNGAITQSKTITDTDGFAKIPVEGGGKFMLSAVHMFDGENDPTNKKAAWLSYWANLTFGLPGADKILAKPKSQ